MILTDTSILIDYLKKSPPAINCVKKCGKSILAVNTVIVMELFRGLLNDDELIKIHQELGGFYMLPISLPVSALALQLSKKYASPPLNRIISCYYRCNCPRV